MFVFVLCCLFDFVLRRYVAECQGEPQNAQERPRSATEPPERRGAPRSAAERHGAPRAPRSAGAPRAPRNPAEHSGDLSGAPPSPLYDADHLQWGGGALIPPPFRCGCKPRMEQRPSAHTGRGEGSQKILHHLEAQTGTDRCCSRRYVGMLPLFSPLLLLCSCMTFLELVGPWNPF